MLLGTIVPMRTASIVFGLILFALFSLAQDYTVSVTTVTVWVRATDKKDQPVNLSASDFQVFEDGKAMPISCFEQVGVKNPDEKLTQETQMQTQAASAESAEPAAQKRKLILAIDIYNTSSAEYDGAKDELKAFVRKLDPAGWSILLAALLPGQPTVAVPFTEDVEKILGELETLRANENRDREIRDRKRKITDMLKMADSKREYAEALMLVEALAEVERRQSLMTLKALAALDKSMGTISAEEHVVIVFISGGLNSEPGREYRQIWDNAYNRSGLAVGEDVDRDFMGRREELNFDFPREVKKSIGLLNRRNVTVYCVNTRGTKNPGMDDLEEVNSIYAVRDPSILKDYQETLDGIAYETGGLSFKSSNNYDKGFGLILNDTVSQYILCYTTGRQSPKEKYHEIKVKVAQSGVKLRHRKGYWD